MMQPSLSGLSVALGVQQQQQQQQSYQHHYQHHRRGNKQIYIMLSSVLVAICGFLLMKSTTAAPSGSSGSGNNSGGSSVKNASDSAALLTNGQFANSIYPSFNSYMMANSGLIRRQLAAAAANNEQQQQQQDELLYKLSHYLPIILRQEQKRTQTKDNSNEMNNLEQSLSDRDATTANTNRLLSSPSSDDHTNYEQLAAMLGQEQATFSDAIDALVLAAANEANQANQIQNKQQDNNDFDNSILLPPEVAPLMGNFNNRYESGHHSSAISNKRAPASYSRMPSQLIGRFGDTPATVSSPVGKRPSGHRYDFGLGKRAGAYQRYDFGLGKRVPTAKNRYDFGLGK